MLWINRFMVYDGSDESSMLIGELFGTPNHRIVKSISSSGKFMLINFKKQHNSEHCVKDWDTCTVEFVAFIKYNKINFACQSWLDKNKLISPYNPNINCSWIITRKFGSYITLDFSFIEVKQMNYYSKNALI